MRISVTQAASVLNVSKQTVRQGIRQGVIPGKVVKGETGRGFYLIFSQELAQSMNISETELLKGCQLKG